MDILYFYFGIIAYVHYEAKHSDYVWTDNFRKFVFIVFCTVAWPLFVVVEFYKLCKGKGEY